jgi:hypothetical protein
MAVSRSVKLFLGAIITWSFISSTGYSVIAFEDPNAAPSEVIPAPLPNANSDNQDTAEESTSIATDQDSELCKPACADNAFEYRRPLKKRFDGLSGRLWVRGDWMLWWTSGSHLPPLVTTGTLTSAGVLGQEGTSVLFGDSTLLDDARNGVRLTIGGWLDNCQRWGLESEWLTLGGKSLSYFQSSAGDPILARPYNNVYYPVVQQEQTIYVYAPAAFPIAYPGFSTGSVSISGNDFFNTMGIALRHNLYRASDDSCMGAACGCDACGRNRFLGLSKVDLLMGYRNYRLGDNLTINSGVVFTNTEVTTQYQFTDNFNTRNEFNGGEIGINTEQCRGPWSLNLSAKMAMGNNRRITRISGNRTIIEGTDVTQFDRGLYALQTNVGRYQNDQFVIIPQFGMEVGYQVTCRLRAYAGYNVLFWSSVMRAGDQIDVNLDTRNQPPDSTPAYSPYPSFLGATSNFWAHGINLGAELRF